MASHIIDELNTNKESASQMLVEVFNELTLISSYSKYCYNLYDSDLFEVFHFEALVRKEWGMEILNNISFKLLLDFFVKWKQYRSENIYGDDEVFVYFDIKWYKLVSEYLIPLLTSFEKDFDNNNIRYKSYKEYYNPDARPSDEDILERGRILYKLLVEGRIIQRKYL